MVLNVLAFLLIGLELGPMIAAAPAGNLGRWVVVGATVLATMIVVRLGWKWRRRCGASGEFGTGEWRLRPPLH